MKTVKSSFSLLPRDSHRVGDGHIGRRELRTILEEGRLPQRRRRAIWLHFATRCPECRSAVADLAPRYRRLGQTADGTQTEPLSFALRDLIELEACRAKGKELHILWSWPSHRSALQRVDDRPLGFVRLYLERVYLAMTDDHPQAGLRHARRALSDVTTSEALRFQGQERFHDLHALALARLAEGHAALLESETAQRRLEKAKRELELGSGDPEIHSSLEEAEAELLRRQGRPSLAHQTLGSAALRLRSLPERRAQTLARQAAVLIELGEPREALAVLARAEAEAERRVKQFDRLRFELDHWRIAALVEIEDYPQAISFLQAAEATYEDACAPPLRKAQRQWMLGHSLLRSGRIDQAEALLRKAFAGYRALGMIHSMAHVFFERCHCALKIYLRSPSENPFPELLDHCGMLAHSPDWYALLLDKLRKVNSLAKDYGVSVPLLHETIAQIEALLGPPN